VIFIVCGAGLITFTEKRRERQPSPANLMELSPKSPQTGG
jgi:hypothetical protein